MWGVQGGFEEVSRGSECVGKIIQTWSEVKNPYIAVLQSLRMRVLFKTVLTQMVPLVVLLYM